jgi:hypothetical protein
VVRTRFAHMSEASDAYDELSDHDLLAGGVHDLAAEAAASAARLGRLLAFHDRLVARAVAAPPSQPPEGERRRHLSALQETIVEAGSLWGLSPGRVRADLSRARVLSAHFPQVWALWRAGRLDGYRAGLVADAATGRLPGSCWPELAERITAWLHRHLRCPGDDPTVPEWVCGSVKQLRNKLTYETTRLAPRLGEEAFRRGYADRHASAHTHPLDGSPGDGIGTLVLTHSVDQVQLADYRLTLAAKALRGQGDGRTLEQLRADVALDLLTGRAQIQTPTGDLEDLAESAEVPKGRASHDDVGAEAGSAAGGWFTRLPALGYARPIINVTVPIQTLMGLSDDPGTLSGGTVIPATLARMIASRPDATWYRLLTDPAGACMERSTSSYRPTAGIWAEVLARYQTCFRAGCDRPAADCEGDHKVPRPLGPTATGNLWPGCGRDHTAKHTPGFTVRTDPDTGASTFGTRAGFSHPVEQASHSAGAAIIPEALFGIQYSATEILDALTYLAGLHRVLRAGPLPTRDDCEETREEAA